MLLCTWLDRSFQTATKILGDFLKWHYFGQEAKVHHYYYDFTRICQNMCCFYQYYYTCINMFKIKRKPRTGSVFMRCGCISKRCQYTVCLVLLCKITENSFTAFEEKIFIEEYFHVCMNGRGLIILSGTLCSLPYTAILALNLYAYVNFND